MEISIYKINKRAALRMGKKTIPIKSYKILSSMDGGTELEVVIKLNSPVMKFWTSAKKKLYSGPSSIARRFHHE